MLRGCIEGGWGEGVLIGFVMLRGGVERLCVDRVCYVERGC